MVTQTPKPMDSALPDKPPNRTQGLRGRGINDQNPDTCRII